ncbi:MAG: hypothetical protein ACLGHN_10840 [Bacteriovoracia bacterium]
MKNFFLFCLLALLSCGKESSTKVYPVTDSSVSRLVNQKSMPADPNLTLDKSLVNNSYPIQLALYEDGQFYYDLPNLGDGRGTWKKSGGKIELKAKRSLFDMHIDIHANDEEAQTLSIQFIDRFGPNTLQMTNVNI